jgi:acetyl esterase/lipase
MTMERVREILRAAVVAGMVAASVCAAPRADAQTVDQPVVLFPGGAPDAIPTAPETTVTSTNAKGKPITRVTNVSVPTMTVYHPAAALDQHVAVLVFPGGGFKFMAYDMEGSEVCQWLNSVGVTAVLLKYRVPAPAEGYAGKLPLEDAQRAIGLVRSHAEEWGIDGKRVGVIGFSAGANLAAAMSTHDMRLWPAVDAADKLPARADFAMVIYPGDVVEVGTNNKLRADYPVDKKTPPTFIVQAENDKLILNSIAYYIGLQAAGVPAEMHLYADGGHGFGLRSEATVSVWPKLAEAWMKSIKVLK